MYRTANYTANKLTSMFFFSREHVAIIVVMQYAFLFIFTPRFCRIHSSDTSQSTTGDGNWKNRLLNGETLYQELPYILNYLPI